LPVSIDIAELQRLLAAARPRPWRNIPFVTIEGGGATYLPLSDGDLAVAAVNVLADLLDELEKLRAVAEIAARMDATLDWDGWMSTAPLDLDVTKMHMALKALEGNK
jgi:hypothetical protein